MAKTDPHARIPAALKTNVEQLATKAEQSQQWVWRKINAACFADASGTPHACLNINHIFYTPAAGDARIKEEKQQ